MASLSSPSTGLHSKTPFKTPGPSRMGTVPTESPSTQQNGASQDDSASSHFVSMLNSINEAFKAEDSQLERVTQVISNTEKPRLEGGDSPPADPPVAAQSPEKHAEPMKSDHVQDSPPPAKPSRTNHKGSTTATKTPNNSAEQEEPEINTSRKRTATRKPTPVPGKAARRAPKAPDGKPTVRRDLLSRMLSGLSDASGLDWADPLIGGKSSRDAPKNASPSSIDSPTSIESSASEAKGESTAETTTSPPEVVQAPPPVTVVGAVSKGEPTATRPTGEKSTSSKKAPKKVSPIIRFGPKGPIQPSSSSSRTKVQDSKTQVPKSRPSTDNRPRDVSEGMKRSSKRPAAAKDNRVSKRAKVANIKRISVPDIEDELASQLHETRCESALITKETRQVGGRARVSETRSPLLIDLTREDTPQKTIEADELSDGVGMVDIPDNSEPSPPYESTVAQPPVNLKPVFEAQRRDATVKADTMKTKESGRSRKEDAISSQWSRSEILSRLDRQKIGVNEPIRTGACSKSQDAFVLHTQRQHEPTPAPEAEVMLRQHILTKVPKPKADKQQSNADESSETGGSRASEMEDDQLPQQAANIRHNLDGILHTIIQVCWCYSLDHVVRRRWKLDGGLTCRSSEHLNLSRPRKMP